MTRVVYLALFFVNAVLAALLREFGKLALARMSSILHVFKECDPYEDQGYCFGNQMVYRMSFSLGCFFVMTAVLSCAASRGCENACCLMCVQLPVYFFIVVGSLFIPNSSFETYVDVARLASSFFIILQIVIIVDWAYNVRDFLLDQMEAASHDEEARQALLTSDYDNLSLTEKSSSATAWEAAYIAIVFVLGAGSTAAIVIMFKWFSGCDLNVAFIILTIFAAVVITVLSVLSWVNVGLLPAAAVTAYLVMMCYQAVHSNPDETCTGTDLSTISPHGKSVLLNATLAALTITWTSWRTSATNTKLFTLTPFATTETKTFDEQDVKDLADIEAGEEGDVVNSNPHAVPEYQFHILMVLASFYMAMTLTNWGSANGLDTDDDQVATMWVKISSQWVAAAIFLWTLVAPAVFPGREFGSP
ncbi:hypothetical protein Poli38472_010093 [Pythium oligandrum]|uniref:Serine incorporator n=1 Tax=Pythium oligandrum TaxID=41045 RepID=A0A8K1C8Q6_PYTOL|nr:hypothetical protein Poli38472_010093 [Pythium oligandrum]|eukprot:TMW58534.1 hypothetical protein Poli38472_010093 [Pythium oligandrum]